MSEWMKDKWITSRCILLVLITLGLAVWVLLSRGA